MGGAVEPGWVLAGGATGVALRTAAVVVFGEVLAVGVGGGSRRRSHVFFFDLTHGL